MKLNMYILFGVVLSFIFLSSISTSFLVLPLFPLVVVFLSMRLCLSELSKRQELRALMLRERVGEDNQLKDES